MYYQEEICSTHVAVDVHKQLRHHSLVDDEDGDVIAYDNFNFLVMEIFNSH